MFELLLPFIGFAIGFLVALTGVGAGAIMTPILLALGFPPISAVGTDLAHSALSKALGTSLYWRDKVVNRRVVAYLLVGSIAAVSMGGFLVVGIRATYGVTTLNLVVSSSIALVLLIAGASYLLIRSSDGSDESEADPRPSFVPLASLGFLIGLAVNITSVGAGSMLMPYLMKKLRSAREIVGTDLTFGFFTTVVATLLQLNLGNVLFQPLLFLLAGSIPGTILGVRFNERVHVQHLRAILATIIIIAGISILVKLLV